MNQNNGNAGGQFTNNGGKSFFTSGGDKKEVVVKENKIKNLLTSKNIYILIGVIILVAIIFVVYKNSSKENNDDVSVHTAYPNMLSVNGSIKDVFGGDNDLNYSFDIPDTATTTDISNNDYLLKITDSNVKQATVYFSYQGNKSLTPEDYISYVVAPHVPIIELGESKTIGNYNWQLAETAGSNWYVALLGDGSWTVAIEAKKVWADQANLIAESFRLK